MSRWDILVILFVLCLAFCLAHSLVYKTDWTNTEIVEAIFKAEGGYKATYLYGIRSVKYEDEAEARQICLNTVINQRRRHSKHDCGKDYLVCLRDRYCPLQAKNDSLGLNSNWLKNVRYFLKRGVK